MSHRAAFTGAALGCVALAASLALLTLPACNECDSSIDPVKCTDLCEQDPPHRDCAQCTGSSPAKNCPQCDEPNAPASCMTGGSGGSGGLSGSGGTGGVGGGGSGGTAGVVSGNGAVGGVGGGGVGGEDAGPPPVDCATSANCRYDLPLCDGEGKCTECATNEVCEQNQASRDVCDIESGGCVECRSDADCKPESPTPHCVLGECKECESHADCSGDLGSPQCSDEKQCEPCTGGAACMEHGDRDTCDMREPATATEGQCVECLTDANCPNERPQCGADGMCGACNEAGGALACAGRMDGEIATPFCNTHPDRATTGLCVQCVSDSEIDPLVTTCDDGATRYSCDLGRGRCTTTEVRALQPCQECVADTECDDSIGLRCVEYPIDGVSPTKSYCFYDRAEQTALTNCPSGLKPFLVESEGASVDGYAATYCVIGTSSCEAFRDALNLKACSSNAMCGLGDPELDTSICTGTTPRCTYSCDTDDECPATQPDCFNNNYCRPL